MLNPFTRFCVAVMLSSPSFAANASCWNSVFKPDDATYIFRPKRGASPEAHRLYSGFSVDEVIRDEGGGPLRMELPDASEPLFRAIQSREKVGHSLLSAYQGLMPKNQWYRYWWADASPESNRLTDVIVHHGDRAEGMLRFFPLSREDRRDGIKFPSEAYFDSSPEALRAIGSLLRRFEGSGVEVGRYLIWSPRNQLAGRILEPVPRAVRTSRLQSVRRELMLGARAVLAENSDWNVFLVHADRVHARTYRRFFGFRPLWSSPDKSEHLLYLERKDFLKALEFISTDAEPR